MNAVTTPAAQAPQFEEGYYQWVPLAPGEIVPPEDDVAAGVAHLAATRLGPEEMAGGGPQADIEIHRAPSGQPVAMTPQRMAVFLESMMVLGNVSIACAKAQVSRPSAYAARRREPGFARAWDAAVVAARTVAESELADRAILACPERLPWQAVEGGGGKGLLPRRGGRIAAAA